MSVHRLVCTALAAAVVLIAPVSASAQEVGVKAGVNFASLPPEEDETPEINWPGGPVAGIWIRTAIADRLSFQAEGLYSEKGGQWVFGPDLSIEFRLRYIEVPLLARGDFGASGSTTRFFVVGGAAPAFKLSARVTSVFQGEERSADADRLFERFDLGLVGGAGVAFGRAVIEARYTHGLLRINTDDNNPADNLNNRAFSLTAGFRIW